MSNKIIVKLRTADATAPTAGQLDVGELAFNAFSGALYSKKQDGTVVNLTGAGGGGAYTASGYTMATSRLLGRTTAGTGAAEEISVGAGLAFSAGSLALASAINPTSIGATTPGTIAATTITATGDITGSGAVSWGGGSSVMNSGHPRSLRIGYSGGNCGGCGYGITYTTSSGVHNYAINDIVSHWVAYDGLTVYAAAAGTVGTPVTWTTVLDARRSNASLLFKANTVLDSANYNSYAPTLTGSGASGTWGINVTGTAGNITAYTINQNLGTGNGVTFANVTAAQFYASDWFRATGQTGIYNSTYNTHWYPTNTVYWSVAAASGSTTGGIIMRVGHEGTIKGYLYWDSGGVGLLNNTGNWGVRMNYGSGGSGGSLYGSWIINSGALTVGEGLNSSDIYMTDADEGTRRIHCNSNRIGFLNQSDGWGAYCDDSGNWFTSYLNTTDDVSSGTISYVMAKFGDNYYRSATAAKVASFISGQTMNINGSSTSCSGNAATVTNGVYTNTGQTISGIKDFNTNNTGMATSSASQACLEAYGTGGGAFMAFHRPGSFATYFGLDSDNVLKVGGWSAGAVAHTILHSANYNSYSPTLGGTGATGTWGISISGTATYSTYVKDYIGGGAAAVRVLTHSGTGAGIWYDGNSTSSRVFLGMDAGTNNSFRLYSAHSGIGQVWICDITTGVTDFQYDIKKTGTTYTNPDYVLEHWATGKIEKYADKDGAAEYAGLRPIGEVESFMRANWHLPRFGQNAGHGLFSGSDALLASVEEAYLYIVQLEKRIADLEVRDAA